tara:strand:+ start:14671 stop:14826 length:156 start_codon:yes stop_codon:yes gene_type:complete
MLPVTTFADLSLNRHTPAIKYQKSKKILYRLNTFNYVDPFWEKFWKWARTL